MRKPRLFTRQQEERAFVRPARTLPELDSLVPFDTVRISPNCARTAEEIGPMAEEILGTAYEFYAEAFTVQGDRTIRDLYLPTQDIITPTFFEPTAGMVRQCRDYLHALRSATGLPWVTIASVHGHGRARVAGAQELSFSTPDRERHAINFLATQSLPTRMILGHTADLSLLLNDFDPDQEDGCLVLSDGYAYHPVLRIKGLPSGEQKKIADDLGLDLGKSSTLDIISAHLKRAGQLAQQEGDYAISAEQHRVLGFNYFLVFDNDRSHKAMIGIQVENTVEHTYQTHLKEVPLEIAELKHDISFDKDRLADRIRNAYAAVIERQKASIVMTSEMPGAEQALTGYHEKIWQEYRMMPDSSIRKQPGGRVGLYELVGRFFHTALAYLDMAGYDDHSYAEYLSDVLKTYAEGQTIPLGNVMDGLASSGSPPKDQDQIFVNQHLDHLRQRIVENIMHGMDDSLHRQLEIGFMRDFAYATHVVEQDRILRKYAERFHNNQNAAT